MCERVITYDDFSPYFCNSNVTIVLDNFMVIFKKIVSWILQRTKTM
nr:MAG TPA: hypothetical protein [Caudoviricetes sp.]